MTTKRRYKKTELIQFVFKVLQKVGFNNLNSKTVAELIVRADVRGVWSHGIVRLPVYIKRIEKMTIFIKVLICVSLKNIFLSPFKYLI